MRNTWKASKCLIKFLENNCIIYICYTIVALLVEMVIQKYFYAPTDLERLAPPNTYGTAVVWMLVIGLIFFKSNFKFLMANGVTRRSFFKAALPALGILAMVWSLITTLFPLFFKTMGNYLLLHEYLYRGSSLAGGILWLFAVLFLIVSLGWLISLLYYRSNTLMKVAISTLLFLSILLLLNSSSGGGVGAAIGRFLMVTMGFSQSPANPYIAVCSMLLAATVIYGFNFLLIRKAELKE